MAKPRHAKYSPADIQNAELRYAETRDKMFLALAVGAMPHKPPLWVIEECARLTDEVAASAARGNSQILMGKRLDAMWRFFISMSDNYMRNDKGRIISNVGPSLAEAARHALFIIDNIEISAHGFDTAMICLQREWRLERSQVALGFEDYELFDGLTSTPRMARVLAEHFDTIVGQPRRNISLAFARFERGVHPETGADRPPPSGPV
jgi:hypothetical protein